MKRKKNFCMTIEIDHTIFNQFCTIYILSSKLDWSIINHSKFRLSSMNKQLTSSF